MNNPTDAPKLRECPFCGDDGAEVAESEVPSIHHDGKKVAVFCNACFCEGPTCEWGKDAIEAWNTRTVPAISPEAVEWLRHTVWANDYERGWASEVLQFIQATKGNTPV